MFRYRPKQPRARLIELSLVSILTSVVTFGLPYFLAGGENCRIPCREQCFHYLGQAVPATCPEGCRGEGEWSSPVPGEVPYRIFPKDPFDDYNSTDKKDYDFSRRFNCPPGQYNDLGSIFLGVREDSIKAAPALAFP